MQNDQLFPPAAATAGATFPSVTTCSLKPWSQNKPTFLKSRFIVSQEKELIQKFGAKGYICYCDKSSQCFTDFWIWFLGRTFGAAG